MESVKHWVTAFSAVSIISGVLISLLPKSSHKNLYRTLTGIIMLYAAICSISNMNNKLELSVDDFLVDNYAVSQNIDLNVQASVMDSAEKAIEDLLLNEAIKYGLQCEFICECRIKNEKIAVVKIVVSPYIDEEKRDIFMTIVDSFDLDRNVVVFEGE